MMDTAVAMLQYGLATDDDDDPFVA